MEFRRKNYGQCYNSYKVIHRCLEQEIVVVVGRHTIDDLRLRVNLWVKLFGNRGIQKQLYTENIRKKPKACIRKTHT